ncbi:MAG: DMT family transporter [Janthinobacterium lividum]
MTSTSTVLAIGLAALGAMFFGLASVRQHRVVRASVAAGRTTLREQVVAAARLVRHPAWLWGVVQLGLGGGLHVAALALAPITLVQPVGVLAVPVTVVATAITLRRRPSRSQAWGTVLSVAGVAALSLVLLVPPVRPPMLPPWSALALGVGTVLAGCAVVALASFGTRAPALVRCVSRALVAAVLYGMNAVMIRTLGQVLHGPPGAGPSAHLAPAPVPTALVVTAIVGIAVVLPLGIWATQSAYLFGSPQVVTCCLILIDPLAAVIAGRALLHDGAAFTGLTLAAAVACSLVATAGVVLLARDHPGDLSADLLPAVVRAT